jgi:hypothetical protein
MAAIVFPIVTVLWTSGGERAALEKENKASVGGIFIDRF